MKKRETYQRNSCSLNFNRKNLMNIRCKNIKAYVNFLELLYT